MAPINSLAQDAFSFEQMAADDPDAEMTLEADELIYDLDEDLVTAEGNVEIYYQDYTVEADRVIYDQNTGRVFARGNVRVVEPDGNIIYADTIELTEDFREGFVEQLTVLTVEDARFAAVTAERMEDNITVFTRGVYTACEPCKSDPDRAPQWQIKAARIIHNREEQVVYYENATFELFGLPVAYMPVLSHPDPSVRRKSGLLPPSVGYSSELGSRVRVPYFFALAPNYDVTVAATHFSKQGVMGEFEWRHRLARGGYTIEGAGIRQSDPDAFRSPGDIKNRGALRAFGGFRINEFWTWGFDGRVTTDRTFLREYNLVGDSEYSNQLFLTGQSARNWFDARIINYRRMSRRDDNVLIPTVHPVVDYDYIFGRPVLGGRLSLNANAVSLTRQDAHFETSRFADANCAVRNADNVRNRAADTPGRDPEHQHHPANWPNNCDLIGVPGQFNRFITKVEWERRMVDSLGQVFTPFASARGDVYAFNVDDPYVGLTQGVPVVGQFRPTGEHFIARGMPAVGLEYRWPFLMSAGSSYHIIEPIAQVIARPNEPNAMEMPNEDAQSFVFDDTILFARDKFSGYDRIEGGTRANVGMRYKFGFANGVSGSLVFGQSYQLAGTNPFPQSSGLETRQSDLVGGATFSPFDSVELAARARFDRDDLTVRQQDLSVRGNAGPVSGQVRYSEIAADPLTRIDFDRREISAKASLQLDENWEVFGSGRYELAGQTPGTQWISNSLGVGYSDECMIVSLTYSRRYVRDGDLEPDQQVMLRFSLRTLAEGQIGSSALDDN